MSVFVFPPDACVTRPHHPPGGSRLYPGILQGQCFRETVCDRLWHRFPGQRTQRNVHWEPGGPIPEFKHIVLAKRFERGTDLSELTVELCPRDHLSRGRGHCCCDWESFRQWVHRNLRRPGVSEGQWTHYNSMSATGCLWKQTGVKAHADAEDSAPAGIQKLQVVSRFSVLGPEHGERVFPGHHSVHSYPGEWLFLF